MLRRGDSGKVLPTDLEARISQRFVDKPFPALKPYRKAALFATN